MSEGYPQPLLNKLGMTGDNCLPVDKEQVTNKGVDSCLLNSRQYF